MRSLPSARAAAALAAACLVLASTGAAAKPGPGRSDTLAFVGIWDNRQSIWWVPRPGSAPRVLFRGGYDPHVSPDGRRLAFSRGRRSYVATVGSSTARPLPGRVVDREPWAPNGRRLVVRDAGLVVVHADGSGPRRLNVRARPDPDWSPDSRRLLHVVERRTAGVYAAGPSTDVPRPVLVEEGLVLSAPDWSPDGTRVVFVRTEPSDGTTDLVVAAADGAGSTRLTSDGSAGHPAWSPDGREIAFSAVVDGNRELFAIAADGTGRRRLTSSPRPDRSPRWSPDGERIAFESGRFGVEEVLTMRRDGTGVVRVTADEENNGAPDWSPDGSTIAYRSTDRVALISPNGTRPRELGARAWSGSIIRWSPDGSRIAFERDDGIRTVAADGTGGRFAFFGPGFAKQPAWRRDGTLTFVVPHGDDVATVDVVNATTARITDTLAYESAPAWSPRGNRLAYLSSTPATRDALVVRDGASSGRRLAAGVISFSWSPSGAFIAYSRGSFVYRIRAAGGRPMRIPRRYVAKWLWAPGRDVLAYEVIDDGAGIEVGIVDRGWQRRVIARASPLVGLVGSSAWSRDGTRLAYAHHSTTARRPLARLSVYDRRTGETRLAAVTPRNVGIFETVWVRAPPSTRAASSVAGVRTGRE